MAPEQAEKSQEKQQIAYGTASALKEALTEKAFDGFVGIYGKGTADDFVDALASRFAKSDGGQAVARGLLNTGGEGAEEVISGFVDPALQSIYNGKTLGENYRDLNMKELWQDGQLGMLLGGFGGSVEIASAGRGQVRSYADVLRKILPEQNRDALGTNAASHDARYRELERKFLDGSIAEHEFEELRKLECFEDKFNAASGKGSQKYQVPDSVEITENRGKMVINKVVFGHSGIPKMADPKSIIDHQNEENGVDARAFYGDDGMKVKELHTSNHGNPKWHNYGRHGEHAHDYEWNEDGSLKKKTTRELNDEEKERNGDIL